MRIFKTLLLLVTLSVACVNAFGEEGLVLDKEKWEKERDGVDYTETYKERETVEREYSETKPTSHTDLSSLKYVFYFIVLVLIVIIIVRVLANLNKNPTIKGSEITVDTIQEIEEKILEIDLDQLLKEAIEAKNLEVALRISFLIIIKALSESNQIEWTKEKTNWEYYDELQNKELQPEFKQVVNSFEHVWYGERKVTESQFFELKAYYDSFIKRLKKNE